MAGTINIKMKKEILEIHAEWLKQNGYKKEYKNCVKQIKDMKGPASMQRLALASVRQLQCVEPLSL